MDVAGDGFEVRTATSTEMGTRNEGTIAAAPQIDSNRPNTAAMKFVRHTNNVGRIVTAAKSVNQDGDPVTCYPAIWLIVVDDQPISIGQIDDSFDGLVFRSASAKQECPDGLKVGQMKSSSGAKWWMLTNQRITPV